MLEEEFFVGDEKGEPPTTLVDFEGAGALFAVCVEDGRATAHGAIARRVITDLCISGAGEGEERLVRGDFDGKRLNAKGRCGLSVLLSSRTFSPIGNSDSSSICTHRCYTHAHSRTHQYTAFETTTRRNGLVFRKAWPRPPSNISPPSPSPSASPRQTARRGAWQRRPACPRPSRARSPRRTRRRRQQLKQQQGLLWVRFSRPPSPAPPRPRQRRSGAPRASSAAPGGPPGRSRYLVPVPAAASSGC